MTDFFDWLTAGDSGLGADRLANAFNLSHDELRGTTDALAPAFAVALQRAMTDPAIWNDLSKRFAPLMGQTLAPGPETAKSTAARELADTLFGSPDVSSAIARKVSLANGVAPDAVEQVMRNLSVMTMQTMVQMMLANMARSQPKGLAEGDYPTAMAEMMRRGANAMEAMGRPSDTRVPRKAAPFGPSSEALADLFSNALTGRLPFLPPEAEKTAAPWAAPWAASVARRFDSPAEPAASPETKPTPNPFEAMMDGFMRGMASPSDGASLDEETEDEATSPSPLPAGIGAATSVRPNAIEPATAEFGVFDDLARAGRQMQDDYARQIMELFGAVPVRNETPADNASKPRR